MWTFNDAQLPTEGQHKALAYLAYLAFVEMRMLGREGKAAQVADLAEALHNLPLMLWHPEFSMSCQRGFFARYQEKVGRLASLKANEPRGGPRGQVVFNAP